jgi:peroxiredoxin
MIKSARLIALIGLLMFGCLGTGGSQTGGPAPDFSLRELTGGTVTLADYQGKVLVLNFWATWCPPCRAEIPDFIDVYKDLNGQGLEIIGVTMEDISASDLAEFANGMKMNYTVAFGTPEIARAYQPGRYIPATIIIDKKGIIRHRHVGLMEKDVLLGVVKPLLSE